MTRAFSTAVGAAAAGALIWVAAQVNNETTGGYWAEVGLLAAAGLALALSRLPGAGMRSTKLSLPTLGIAFLPSLLAAGWIIVATQPDGNTFRSHVVGWSSDIGVMRVVRDLSPHAIVLALGLGAVLGLVFERRVAETDVTEPMVAEPVPSRCRSSPRPDEQETVIREPELVRR